MLVAMPAGAARPAGKPNIILIMGDDIGWFNVGAYHQGIMAGRTPKIDRLLAEGMRFSDYYAEASCWFGYQFSRFVMVQQLVAEYAKSFVEFPPMQRGASFNLEAIKAQIPKAIPSQTGQ